MGSKRLPIAVVLVLSLSASVVMTSGQRHSTSRSCSLVLDSEVCVWVTMEGEAAVELGATVPISLIEAVPADAEMVWPPEPLATVALPAEARTTLGIDHLGINWEAHGHPPSPFMAPHFDFHFYNLSPSDVRAIDCSDETKPLRVPARHTLPDVDVPGLGVLVGLCVPQMGMHAMHNGLVDGTEAFEASLVLGYYGGEPVFFEPMISRERLLERTGFALDVPAVEGLPDGVHYPRQFHAEYDAEEEVYRMTFTDFR